MENANVKLDSVASTCHQPAPASVPSQKFVAKLFSLADARGSLLSTRRHRTATVRERTLSQRTSGHHTTSGDLAGEHPEGRCAVWRVYDRGCPRVGHRDLCAVQDTCAAL